MYIKNIFFSPSPFLLLLKLTFGSSESYYLYLYDIYNNKFIYSNNAGAYLTINYIYFASGAAGQPGERLGRGLCHPHDRDEDVRTRMFKVQAV